jgi:hypothetical protein
MPLDNIKEWAKFVSESPTDREKAFRINLMATVVEIELSENMWSVSEKAAFGVAFIQKIRANK